MTLIIGGLHKPQLYKTLDFKYDTIAKKSQVVLWWKPTNTQVVPKESVIILDLPWTSTDPATIYNSPGPRNIIDKDGLGMVESCIPTHSFNLRQCYQNEYDEYFHLLSIKEKYVTDEFDFDAINIFVWQAVLEYMKE